jgi:hypothetical protein
MDLVLQALGIECAACYVLGNCSVLSPAGFCTSRDESTCSGEEQELQEEHGPSYNLPLLKLIAAVQFQVIGISYFCSSW